MERRARVLIRDAGVCRCDRCKASGELRIAHQVDHRIPLWEGGTDDDGNLQAINADCHRLKSADEAKRREGSGG
jgi:5-methylcytosine-specific restriction protein A